MSIVEKSIKRAQEAARTRVELVESVQTPAPPSLVGYPASQAAAPEAVTFRVVESRLRIADSLDGHPIPSIRQGGRTRLAGQMRTLKLNVLERMTAVLAAGMTPVLLVTSALPGDGKSFITLNLALSLARERSLRVTLVDADLARRRTSHVFGAERLAGVFDWLEATEKRPLDLHTTEADRLFVLSAGSERAEEADMLSQSTWAQLIAGLRARGPNQVVVVDSAPVLATGDAQFLSASSDLVLFVVRALETPAGSVTEAVGRLGDDPSRIVCVLNGSASADESYSYYYGDTPRTTDRGAK
jgi:protein-tyrosine kinase